MLHAVCNTDTNEHTKWPEPTNDWAADCLAGRTFARSVISAMKQSDSAPMLGNLVRQNGAEWSGVQVGFFQHLAERLQLRLSPPAPIPHRD